MNLTYDEAKADCFAALLPQIGDQFKWLKPPKEEHMVCWGFNTKTKIVSFHVSYTGSVRQFELPHLWYALAQQIVVPLQWR